MQFGAVAKKTKITTNFIFWKRVENRYVTPIQKQQKNGEFRSFEYDPRLSPWNWKKSTKQLNSSSNKKKYMKQLCLSNDERINDLKHSNCKEWLVMNTETLNCHWVIFNVNVNEGERNNSDLSISLQTTLQMFIYYHMFIEILCSPVDKKYSKSEYNLVDASEHRLLFVHYR